MNQPAIVDLIEPAIFGLPQQTGYTFNRDFSYSQIPVLSGRSRFRLQNPRSKFVITLQYEWDDNQLNDFEIFWANVINYGANQFEVPLQIGYGSSENVPVLVQALVRAVEGGYQVNSLSNGRWEVRIAVETSQKNLQPYPDSICDIIYGGPLTLLADDDINANPITNLPTDVVDPCEILI